MLNLLRVETGGLLKSRIFLITVLLYVVTVGSTFVSLSYSEQFASGMTSDLATIMRDYGVAEEEVQRTIDTLPDELSEIDAMMEEMRGSENFIEYFHANSSGQFAMVVMIGMIYILYGFRSGAIKNTLLCGYSRRQLYVAKIVGVFLTGCVFLMISMIMVALIGMWRFGMPLNGAILLQALEMLLGQCVALLQYVVVTAAFACALGNGWAVLGVIATFSLLPLLGSFLDTVMLAGRNFFFMLVPTFVSTGSIGPMTMYQWLARPYLWTPGTVLGALVIGLVICAGATAWGLRVFERKQF